MKSDDILTAILSAVMDLRRFKSCAIDLSIASQFATAISAMGLCICGGAIDVEHNLKWFYLDNKHNDYKI